MDTFLRCVTCDSKPFCFSCFAEDVTDTSHIGHRVVQVTAGATATAAAAGANIVTTTTAAAADLPPAGVLAEASPVNGRTSASMTKASTSNISDSETKSKSHVGDTSGVMISGKAVEAGGVVGEGVPSNIMDTDATATATATATRSAPSPVDSTGAETTSVK
jgi:hypothetical protein